MIDFVEVYRRAVYMIKDPHLSRSFSTDTVRFCKEMYPFLRNGVSKITAPPQVAALLAEQQPPEGKMEIFEEKRMQCGLCDSRVRSQPAGEFSRDTCDDDHHWRYFVYSECAASGDCHQPVFRKNRNGACLDVCVDRNRGISVRGGGKCECRIYNTSFIKQKRYDGRQFCAVTKTGKL